MQKDKKYYTIMFIPEGEAKPFSVHVYRSIVYSAIFFFIVFFIGSLCLLLKSGEIAAKLQLVYALRSENKKLIEENNKLNFLRDKIEKIEVMGAYLQKMATIAGDPVKQKEQASNLLSKPGEDVGFKTDTLEDKKDIKQKSEVSQGFFAAVPNIEPTEGWITRKFVLQQNDTEQVHWGVDFAATSGTLIRATARGMVEDVYKDTYFGLIVVIKHGYGFISRYGHCSQVLVAKGDHIERGQTIALVGNTGRSSAPHLHYEVIKDGKMVDPLEYIIRIQK
jgi:murein DD-endopeptidase MepM/ murein hydrolase activator NlpD